MLNRSVPLRSSRSRYLAASVFDDRVVKYAFGELDETSLAYAVTQI
jgi:hypothetical protein